MNDELDELEYYSAATVLYAVLCFLSFVCLATAVIVGILGGYFG